MRSLNNIFTTALIAVSLNAFAGNCPSLSGNLTIGKSESADFASVTDAVTALECGGVSGPVTFRLESGVYNERIVILSIPGASAMNPITFESKSGSNTETSISYGLSDATLVLNGTSHISFQNISIDHSGAIYGNAMRVDGKTNDIHFKGVVFTGVESARTGANSAVVYFASNAPKTSIVFEDCEVNNGSVGIMKGGVSAETRDSKTSISGTLFFNQYESGLVLTNEDAPIINNNVVSSLSTYAAFKGIALDNVSGCIVVSSNILTLANGSIGLYLNNCVAEATHLGQVSNNSIAVGGKASACGLLISGSTDNQVLNFNRVKLITNGKAGANQVFYLNNGSGNNINMLNDIMYDLVTGAYTIIGNTYKDMFNQLPAQGNPALTASVNGLMIEKDSPIK